MDKQNLKQKLTKYNYAYKEQFDKLIVKLDASLEVQIDYSENGKIIITDKLRGWNYLTGIWDMSVKGSVLFNTIGSFIYFIIYAFINSSIDKPYIFYLTIILFLLGVFWIILWTTYYLVKLESFKMLIQSWDKT